MARGSRVHESIRGALACGVLLLGLLPAACAVNPVTGERQLVLMSEAEEVRTGERLYPMYTQMSEGLFQDAALQAYVQEVGARLAAASHRPELRYEFNVVNDAGINAYALPGGKISITRGLLARMENEAQLASVLGHEIGHVTARHAAAGQTRQVLAGLLTTAGAVALEAANVQGGQLLAQGGMLASNLVLTKYSRDQERQSDELGMDYMTALGYNPQGMVQTMEILKAAHDREPSSLEALFQSHPLTSERIDTARRLAAQQPRELAAAEKLRSEPFVRATRHLRDTAPAYAMMEKGRKALAEGDATGAVAQLVQATQQAPGEALIWTYRAAAEAESKDTAAALRSAEKAVELYPGLFRARLTAGVLAFEEKQHARSLEHLEAANGLVPAQPPVLFYAGRNYEAQDQRQRAAEAYAAVLKQVQKGQMAEYSYRRLVEWGYVKPPPKQGG